MLNEAELLFLQDHGLTPGDVFDARSMSKEQRQAEARRSGKLLAIGTPCNKAQHRLRTGGGGHCVQCSPKYMTFQLRDGTPGYVYILGSLRARLTKIGTTQDIKKRHSQVKAEAYGGANDWELLFYIKVSKGGKVEQEILSQLIRYEVHGEYAKSGQRVVARELRTCGFSIALKAVLDKVDGYKIGEPWRSSKYSAYEF